MENIEKSRAAFKKSTASISKQNIGLTIENELCFDPLKVAKSFNQFYTTVVSKLVLKIPCPSLKFGKYFIEKFYSRKGILPNSYSFSSVSDRRVLEYLKNLSSKKATALDGIPAMFIVDSADVIAHPLSHVINLSLLQGVVPHDLKTARVVPL